MFRGAAGNKEAVQESLTEVWLADCVSNRRLLIATAAAQEIFVEEEAGEHLIS